MASPLVTTKYPERPVGNPYLLRLPVPTSTLGIPNNSIPQSFPSGSKSKTILSFNCLVESVGAFFLNPRRPGCIQIYMLPCSSGPVTVVIMALVQRRKSSKEPLHVASISNMSVRPTARSIFSSFADRHRCPGHEYIELIEPLSHYPLNLRLGISVFAFGLFQLGLRHYHTARPGVWRTP